jgi:hypothetical protein
MPRVFEHERIKIKGVIIMAPVATGLQGKPY